MGTISSLAKRIGAVDSKQENDTLKLWESYREQATLWRTLSLLQLGGTILLVLFSFYVYSTRSVTLHVPRQPLPGQYNMDQIPEIALAEQATELVNLIATYQPHVAEKQFRKALEFLDEPALSQFKEEMLGSELRVIKSTSRTQVFFVDPLKTTVERTPHGLEVSLEGERAKIISGKQVPSTVTRYTVTFITKPRNALNRFGLVARNIVVQNLDY